MLILVRHGQSESNAAGMLVGRANVPLTGLGREQAGRTGRLLAAEQRQSDRGLRIISSPLGRTRDTAAIIASQFADPPSVTIESRLIELHYGELEGRRPNEVESELWAAWRANPSFVPPGGESFEQLHARLDSLWESLREETVSRDVIAVSHVSPIKACVAWALGTGPELAWKLSLGVCAITRVRTGPGAAALVSFGETGHLVDVS